MFDEEKTRPIVAEVIRQARIEALEEAAKIAESKHSDNLNTHMLTIGRDIAAAIRERASK